jgi:hypothetical protein
MAIEKVHFILDIGVTHRVRNNRPTRAGTLSSTHEAFPRSIFNYL